MDTEEERGDQGRRHPSVQAVDQPEGQQAVEEMKDDVGQMIAERVQSEEVILDGEGELGQGFVSAQMGGGEDMEYVLPVQMPDLQVILDVQRVVPVDETVVQGGEKGGRHRCRDYQKR